MASEMRGSLPPQCTAVVVVFHGGHVDSHRPVGWWWPPVLLLIPLAAAIKEACGPNVGVVRVKNAVQGWNGELRSPIAGARWALQTVRERCPGVPIVLVGHSLGGRIALNLMDETDVTAVVALAPWIVDEDGISGHHGQSALLLHGTDDTLTDPALTERQAALLSERGVQVSWHPVERDGHNMLRRFGEWRRLVCGFVTDTLGLPGSRSPAGRRTPAGEESAV